MVHGSINFSPNNYIQSFYIQIIDDVMEPKLEGLEDFVVYLSNPTNCKLSEPQEMEITIDDRENDGKMVYIILDVLIGDVNIKLINPISLQLQQFSL